MKSCFLFIAGLFFFAFLKGQELPIPRNIQPAFEKGTRLRSGQPGPAYWQNTGNEEIEYVNNSPDTLHKLVIKLYPNYYKKGAARTREINPEDVSEGMSIKSLIVDQKEISEKDIVIESTNMFVKVNVYPGQKVRIMIFFSYVLNKGSHNRTGQVDEGSYFIAYFFPRIAVYDDIDGWNLYPYTGSYEFYHDFCNFNLTLRVPSRYVVWATGDHVNRAEVFTETVLKRLLAAETSDEPVTVIDTSDYRINRKITRGQEINQWQFEARNVPDIALAISDHYIWQSTSLVVDKTTSRRTRVDAVFNPVHNDYFMVLGDARKTIEAMSFRFPKWPFPYAHETVFDGLDQMEYPMMANDNPMEERAESIELTDHEIFHTLFPFYMGINETKYGWMDEGWATLGEWLISPMIDSTIVDQYGLARCERAAGTESDGVIMDLTPALSGEGFFVNSYPKPALGYLYVKDMLGEDIFFKGLHHYMKTWNGKHPIPLDFFHCMNEGSGKNLNWFWLAWFYEPGVPDLAVASVRQEGKSKNVVIEMKGSKPVPVDITVLYEDQTREVFHKTIEVWKDGNRKTSIQFSRDKMIRTVELGSTYTVDVDRSNNIFRIN
jgi:hypothetical protein